MFNDDLEFYHVEYSPEVRKFVVCNSIAGTAYRYFVSEFAACTFATALNETRQQRLEDSGEEE
jgi:hypothetical protein